MWLLYSILVTSIIVTMDINNRYFSIRKNKRVVLIHFVCCLSFYWAILLSFLYRLTLRTVCVGLEVNGEAAVIGFKSFNTY